MHAPKRGPADQRRFTEFSGLGAVLCGFTVALRQAFPTRHYSILGRAVDNSACPQRGRSTACDAAQRGPALALASCIVLAALGLIPTSQLLLAIFGILVCRCWCHAA